MREQIESGKAVFGLCNMYPASGIIEGMCKGWDFVWIDGQHGEHDYRSILNACQAARGVGVDVLLRVPSYDCSYLGHYADLNPAALMIPMVNTVHQARAVVQATRFPPLGDRSFGGRRVIDLEGRGYHQDDNLLIVVQVETMESVDNVEEIIAVDGIDALFVGPDDMKVRMGIPINTPALQHKKLIAAMRRTAEAARNAGKCCGCIAGNADDQRTVLDMGYQFVIAGSDSGFLRSAATQRLESIKVLLQKG